MNCEHDKNEIVTCGNCDRKWCGACDPAPAALCHFCHGRGSSPAELLNCGHPPTPDPGCGTGYATNSNGERHCYDCAFDQELADVKSTGKIFAYLTEDNGKYSIKNWSGRTYTYNVRILSESRDNFGGERTYLRFEIDGHIYSGFGLGVGMYLRAKRTKLGSLYS